MDLVISPDLTREFGEVTKREKINLSNADIDSFEESLVQIATFVVPKAKVHVNTEDEDDNRVLECAVEGKADFIVSGDKHLLRLREYAGIRILRASQVLQMIEHN